MSRPVATGCCSAPAMVNPERLTPVASRTVMAVHGDAAPSGGRITASRGPSRMIDCLNDDLLAVVAWRKLDGVTRLGA